MLAHCQRAARTCKAPQRFCLVAPDARRRSEAEACARKLPYKPGSNPEVQAQKFAARTKSPQHGPVTSSSRPYPATAMKTFGSRNDEVRLHAAQRWLLGSEVRPYISCFYKNLHFLIISYHCFLHACRPIINPSYRPVNHRLATGMANHVACHCDSRIDIYSMCVKAETQADYDSQWPTTRDV